MKPWVRSVGAVAAGFAIVAIASTLTDAVMHATGIFPSSPASMSGTPFALASAYRAVFTVAGGYTTAALAPDRPLRHGWILSTVGLAAGLAGLVGYYAGGANLGPAWYAVSIPLEAVPCVMLGAWLATPARTAAV